jgi:hypothetical protein
MSKKLKEISRSFNIKTISCVLLFSYLLNSCNPVVKTLGPFSSQSILESKKVGVFLWKYEPVNLIINDTIQIQTKEIFAEKGYSYNSYNDLTYNISDKYSQINIILLKPLSVTKIFGFWEIENFEHPNDFVFVRNFVNKYPPDSLEVKIVTENLTDKNYKPKLLGSFILRKIN